MDKERDLDPKHITEQERDMAQVVSALMQDGERLAFYRRAAYERAQVFTYENYVRRFCTLADEKIPDGPS